MTKYNPGTTYRIQFHKQYSLNDVKNALNYLYKLGIKTIYASPVFEAEKGSMHGYDVANPLVINPELGTEADFNDLISLLHERGMGWLQDIVPNHMVFSVQNPWIYDVLEKGKESIYFSYFDFLENHPDKDLNEKIMLPFLGKPLDEAITDRELSVAFTEEGFKLQYFDNLYPLSEKSIRHILTSGKTVPGKVQEVIENNEALNTMDFNQSLIEQNAGVKNYVTKQITEINNNPHRLKTVIDLQHYYPTFWRDTENKINYRRFFTINSLICTNIQSTKILDVTHKLIRQWVKSNKVQGLRIDHIDGLYNPDSYLERLRDMMGSNTYIVIEKILEKDEEIPLTWPVEGTTGYDFLGMVNNLLTNPEKGPEFYSYYNQWINKSEDFDDIFYRKSRFILYKRLLGELENLTRECLSLPSISRINIPENEIKTAIGEFLIFVPVYKIYGAPGEFSKKQQRNIRSIIDNALSRNPRHKEALKALLDLFLLKHDDDKKETARVDMFFRHCMQFTGPLMAKGIEDTAFYSYTPFIGHNEVGDSPAYFGIRTDTFHSYMQRRQKKFPLTMNCISTHDTKRGEDARARLNVLSDIPHTWIKFTSEWRKMNAQFKIIKSGKEVPTPNDEYFIYQVLIAHTSMDGRISESFVNRVKDYLIKAMREAKVNSSWSNPDEDYEQNTLDFIDSLLTGHTLFTNSLKIFLEEIIPHGIINSLSQLILKNMVPGIPDTYQGTEIWNLSFVDPDNRQPVDYAELSNQLDAIIQSSEEDALHLARKLWDSPTDARLKHWITWITLQERRHFEPLFLEGNYIPLKVTGKYEKNIFAFYRNFFHDDLIVAVPLNTAGISGKNLWEDTWIHLPAFKSTPMENRLTKEVFNIGDKINTADLFSVIPFAILRNTSR